MGRAPIIQYWVDAVRVLVLNEDPIPSAPVIHSRLSEWASETERTDKPPSVRKIVDLVNEAKGLADSKARPYRLFRWPESMESGALPWEASSVCLELLSYYEQHGHGRPPVRLARWYWYVSQIIEEDAGSASSSWMVEPPFYRVMAASRLAALEALGPFAPQDEIRALEHWLAYVPWRSPDASRRYEDDAGVKFPKFRGSKSLDTAIPDDTDPDRVRMAFEILYGKMADWAMQRRRREQQKGDSK